MTEPDFSEIERILAAGDATGFDALAAHFESSGNYPGVFEARLMKKRLELGLPLLAEAPLEGLEPEALADYERTQLAAARETGALFLQAGDVYRAWPYFRAIGDPSPIRAAIENFKPAEGDDRVDGIVEIAYHEQVHPAKGFALILEQYGTCRAITNFGHYPADEGREESARLLVGDLHKHLRASLVRAIESAEEIAPQSASITELVTDRDWLFDAGNYFIDNSHVASVVTMALDWQDPAALGLALELTEYGRRLDKMFQPSNDPPFDNLFVDAGYYLKAVLGEEADQAVEHFRGKLSTEPDPYGDAPAQALVKLLTRLGRYAEALDVAEARLLDVDPARLACATPTELCGLAADYERMKRIARATGNLMAYAAAVAKTAT